jgi:hypothetical protein
MKNINEEFGQKVEIVEEPYKQKAISPFDFLNSINYSKETLIVDEWSEKQYNAYVINKGLSFSPDTVIQANEMNSRSHLDKLLQYSFLINIVRPKKRFNKWIKSEKIEAIEIVKDYYGYSTEKARQVVSILTIEQIDTLKQKLQKGGVNDKGVFQH